MNHLLQNALDMASGGYEVGPLTGKRPLTQHGFKDFTTNPTQIEQWWHEWPNANIGMRITPGHIVIDVDPRNGGNKTWQEANRGRAYPQTLKIATGGGGWHYWFKLPHDGAVKGQFGAGVDIKTRDSGYVVAPGSIHPDTKQHYELHSGTHCWFLPVWLHNRVYRAQRKVTAYRGTKNASGLVRAVLEAQPGERNNILFWALCRNYEEQAGVEDQLCDAARQIGLDHREIMSAMSSAGGRYL